MEMMVATNDRTRGVTLPGRRLDPSLLWRGTGRGATPEARLIPDQLTALREERAELGDDPELRRAGRQALVEAFRDCSAPDWDGYGADPADPLSAAWAEEVVGALLPLLGLPHYAFDPEGGAVVEWCWSSDRLLHLSIGRNGELRYAARVGGSRLTGIEPFAEGLPPGLLSVVRRLMK